MANLQGGCLCGKVRYTISMEPAFSGVCHCTNCQKSTSSAFSVVVGVPSAGVALTGTTKAYVGHGDSGGEVTRRFCPECGSAVTSEPAMMAGMTMVLAGTLDHPEEVKPAMHIFCDSKMPWVPLPEGVGTFPGMPPRG